MGFEKTARTEYENAKVGLERAKKQAASQKWLTHTHDGEEALQAHKEKLAAIEKEYQDAKKAMKDAKIKHDSLKATVDANDKKAKAARVLADHAIEISADGIGNDKLEGNAAVAETKLRNSVIRLNNQTKVFNLSSLQLSHAQQTFK